VNKLGWALILVGGGLAVYGVVQLLSKPAAEPGDPDYDPALDPEFDPPYDPAYDQADWGSDKGTKTDPSDLNDGV